MSALAGLGICAGTAVHGGSEPHSLAALAVGFLACAVEWKPLHAGREAVWILLILVWALPAAEATRTIPWVFSTERLAVVRPGVILFAGLAVLTAQRRWSTLGAFTTLLCASLAVVTVVGFLVFQREGRLDPSVLKTSLLHLFLVGAAVQIEAPERYRKPLGLVTVAGAAMAMAWRAWAGTV